MIRRVSVLLGLAVAFVAAQPTSSSATVISINQWLTNANFEGGSQLNGCPVSWVCSVDGGVALVGVGQPTSAQYPLNPTNGLPSGYAPSGSSAAANPIVGSTTGTMSQVTNQQFAFGNSYELLFWVGYPLTGNSLRVDARLTTSNATISDSLCNNGGNRGSALYDSPGTPFPSPVSDAAGDCTLSVDGGANWEPAFGDWRQYKMTFTPGASFDGAAAGNAGVFFTLFAGSAIQQGGLTHLDMAGPASTQLGTAAVPEPGTLALMGLGLAAGARRLRARKR